jgi:hypothetical protein
MMLTEGGDNLHVQMAAMTNPKRRDSAFAQRAEPIGGWRMFDLETSEEWTSAQGYHVLRLDGAKCENVVYHKEIKAGKRESFPGLLSYEGFMALEALGPNNPDRATFGRGAYPTETASYNIIPAFALDDSRGTFIWKRAARAWATLDSAFEEGGDQAIYTAGQYGEAIGFIPDSGAARRFAESRWAIQFDQQFAIEKKNTLLMAKDVMKLSSRLGVTPEWFAMDRTGNAKGLHDALQLNWGNTLGVNWGEAATEMTVLEEDSEKSVDIYDDVVTEMFFAFGRWAEFGYLAFSPGMETGPLFAQLSSRRYRRIGKIKVRIERKDEYKKRLSTESPDEADSAVMAVHLVRQRSTRDQVHAMEPEKHIVQRQDDFYRDGSIHNYGEDGDADRMERITLDG